VQGFEKVGSALVDLLLAEGAEVYIAAINRALVDSASLNEPRDPWPCRLSRV
jgi:hypothetical protein